MKFFLIFPKNTVDAKDVNIGLPATVAAPLAQLIMIGETELIFARPGKLCLNFMKKFLVTLISLLAKKTGLLKQALATKIHLTEILLTEILTKIMQI